MCRRKSSLGHICYTLLVMLTWLEISKSAILHNLNQFKKLYPQQIVIPVIKANAYGAGFEKLISVIKSKVNEISVVSTTEALIARKLLPKHRIVVLSIIDPDDLTDAIQNRIELPLYNHFWLKKIENSAKKTKRKAIVHIKIDTGTHRIGFTPKNISSIIATVTTSKHLTLKGVFSHYAASEELPDFTKQQRKKFDNIVSCLKLPHSIQIHMACSAAGLIRENPTSCNALRLGISLYGYWPSKLARTKAPKNLTLKPAISWKTKIIHLQQIEKGESIGYGCTYKVNRFSTIATIPVGYFDGYNRLLSNNSEMLIHGKRCPVRGRICMNLIMIDVSKIKNVKIGDEVILLGTQKQQEISAEELATKSSTINYEFISRINENIPRVLVK